jgi:4-amino-4-deoxy-L-arabinose transferase-like glycosyltransferase
VRKNPQELVTSWAQSPTAGWLLIAIVTLLLRFWILGDPIVNIDEQFYLTVGERMLHGQMPYVDIWDRKPIGLFLIYALAGKAFGDAVIGYQLLAAAAAASTAILLYELAIQVTSRPAALAGAICYTAWLLVFGGVAGQSPVFYNLPMMGAALLVVGAIATQDDRRLTRRGCLAMVLAGIAIQIKYTVVFEGVFFGLSLLWAGWAGGRNLVRLTGDAALWVAFALSPTLVAFLYYWSQGHAAEFVQANFWSIFGDYDAFLPAFERLCALLPGLIPLWLCAWIVWRKQRSLPQPRRAIALWTLAWCGASLGGILVMGMWIDHYMLPLLAPLSLLAALAFGAIERPWRLVVPVVGLGIVGGLGRAVAEYTFNGNHGQITNLAALVKPRLGSGCLYVNEDEVILYNLVNSCLPTRYIFPQHLVLNRYNHALGIGQADELLRVLNSRPSVIVISRDPDDDTTTTSHNLLFATLNQSYIPAGLARVGDVDYAVFARRNNSSLPPMAKR